MFKAISQFFVFFICIISLQGYAQTYNGTGGNIQDFNTTTFSINVSGLSIALNDSTFGLEQICINATHTYDADITCELQAPDGTIITLFSSIGGGNDNFTNTCLNSNASSSIYVQNAPFSGTFKPATNLSFLNNGQNGNGLWKLIITDNYQQDDGDLISWGITFGNSPAAMVPFTSSNLPIVVINTNGQQIVDEPKIAVNLGIIDNGAGNINHITDPFNHYNGFAGIEFRGSSSQGFPKKSYGFETWTSAAGIDTNVALMGMPSESDWILNANYSDKTLMRNTTAYYLAQKMGNYASRFKYCEVVINGEYRGVYIFMEKIKRDSHRVAINKLEPTDNTGNNLTGGYIVKVDKTTGSGGVGWTSNFAPVASPNGQEINFLFDYPSDVDITTQQANYIHAYVDSFETALDAPYFANPLTGYRKYIDVTSFIDMFLMNELSKNVDGYRISTYLHKKRLSDGGKLFAGPIWDYDIAFRNANYCEGELTTGWAYQFGNICGTDNSQIPFWWQKLLQDPNFTNDLKCRWNQLRSTYFTDTYIASFADSISNLLVDAQGRNFDKWPIIGSYVWPNPNPIDTSYGNEIIRFKTWIHNRISWLDNNMPGVCNPVGNIAINSSKIKVQPNPFHEKICIVNLPNSKNKISIYNQLGQLILTEVLIQNQTQVEINTIQLPSGTYMLKISNDEGCNQYFKLIK